MSNNLGVIAFCGSKGSGKSTSASLFKEFAKVPTEEIAIAGHLKESCAKVFGVEYDKFINPALKEVELENYIVLDKTNVRDLLEAFFVTDYKFDQHVRPHLGRVLRTPRALLQYIGTEVLHPIDPLIHVKAAIQKKDPAKLTMITDLRFVAEFEFFSTAAFRFVPVYVKNPYAEIAASVDAHPSERQFENFKSKCLVLNNDGTMAQLKDNLIRLITETYGEQV